jgi:hypothetical protein
LSLPNYLCEKDVGFPPLKSDQNLLENETRGRFHLSRYNEKLVAFHENKMRANQILPKFVRDEK